MIRKIIMSFALLALLVSAVPRKSIALMDFKESGQIKGFTPVVRAQFESLINGLKRLTIVERDRIDAIMKEQQLMASGVVDEGSAMSFGGLLGVNYLLFGEIVQATLTGPVKKTEQRYKVVNNVKTPDKFVVWEEITATTSLSVKIVDITNGMIKFSKTAQNSAVGRIDERIYDNEAAYRKEMKIQQRAENLDDILTALAKQKKSATADNLEQTHAQLISGALSSSIMGFRRDLYFAFPLQGVIIQIVSPKTVMIDIGSDDGMGEKVKLNVFRIGPPIKHPTTGKLLENKKKFEDELKVIEVTGQTCIAQGGKGFIKELQVGDTVESARQLILR